jgi:hypothetical protein
MRKTSKTVGRLLAGGLLTATAATLIALPAASAAPQCDQTVGNSIDAYLQRHPDLHQQLQSQAQGEGDGSVIEYLNRHPDIRQHLIDLSAQCAP